MAMNFEPLQKVLGEMLAEGVPGYDCAVYYHHQPVFRQTAGCSDREKQIPMRDDRVYRIFSCTKVITVTAALQLVEQGKLGLDDPLSRYLPEYAHMKVQQGDELVDARSEITIRDLFRMTAGFHYDTSCPSVLKCKEETGGLCPTREVVRYLAEEPLLFHPHTHWNYSLGHDVLGAVIEVVSGQSLGDYLEEHIFKPCGMSETTFHPTPELMSRMATAYRYSEETDTIELMPEDPPYMFGPAYESGGAGLYSTVNDYCRFQEAFISGKLLGAAYMEMLHTSQLNEAEQEDFYSWPGLEKRKYTYGLGVRLARTDSGLPPEFGWGGAAGSVTMMDLEHEITFFYAQHVFKYGNERVAQLRGDLRGAVYESLGFEWKK